MTNALQVQALQEYVACLERELQAKSNEQQTLYRALQENQKELDLLDELYRARRDLTQEVGFLRAELQTAKSQQGQYNEVITELEWSRGEILRLTRLLQENSNMINQAEDKLEDLYEQNQQMGSSISTFQSKMAQELSEKASLREQLQQQAAQITDKQREIDSLEEKLEALSYNYVKVEQAVLEKDYTIHELRQQAQQTKGDLELLRQQLGQRNIMISCLQSELEEARQTYRSKLDSPLQGMLGPIEKVDLVRQTNYLVERVNFLQIQNQGRVLNVNPKQSKLQRQLEEVRQSFEVLCHDLQL